MVSIGKLLGLELSVLMQGSNVAYIDDSAICGLPTKHVRLACRGKQRMTTTIGSAFTCSAAGNGASGSQGIDVEKYRSRLEALLYCGKEVPEEKIEKPTGVPTRALAIGNKPRCYSCDAKGAVECPTCTGSGLYVDSILESQGIIVKVKCLGCGGTGSTMCPKCGGRGHAHT